MKKYIVAFLLFSIAGFSQNLNHYQYALVPAKFSFLKETNQFNANVMTKLFMKKYGFDAYFETETEEVPKEFLENNCNKVYVDLIENNTAFTTKLKVVLKDCKGNILATSPEGTSREKDYNVAYNQAIRMAFEGFSILKMHKYSKQNNVSDMETRHDITDNVAMPPEIQYKAVQNKMGYDVVNESGTVICKLFKTTQNEVFIAEKGNQKGVFIKLNTDWIFEYYLDNKLILEEIDVKF